MRGTEGDAHDVKRIPTTIMRNTAAITVVVVKVAGLELTEKPLIG
jgi:hypothetical protein